MAKLCQYRMVGSEGSDIFVNAELIRFMRPSNETTAIYFDESHWIVVAARMQEAVQVWQDAVKGA